jgi:hypothetical protein
LFLFCGMSKIFVLSTLMVYGFIDRGKFENKVLSKSYWRNIFILITSCMYCSQTLLFFLVFSNNLILRVPNNGYHRNASCAVNLISTFLLLSLGRYHWCWTISNRIYHPHSSQCFATYMFYQIYLLLKLTVPRKM